MTPGLDRRGRALARAAAVSLVTGGLLASWACASDQERGFGEADAGIEAGAPSGAGAPPALGGADAAPFALTIEPASPVVDVTIEDGVVTASAAVSLRAVSSSGAAVAARWSLDRGELGSIDPALGTFRASAALGGAVTVTATTARAAAATRIEVRLHVTQNGRAAATDAGMADAGMAGGVGGVGGEGLGGRVTPPGLVDRLRTEGAPLADLAMLYPYNGTVWPRGLLAPLLQWSTATRASAVHVHLFEADFEFDGFYSLDGLPDPARHRQPIDEAAWTMATRTNQGDPLSVALKVYAPGEDAVYGPLAQSWSVSPASLKGTIYYNSYDSRLVQTSGIGALLALRVGATEPRLAVPSTRGKCVGCHTLAEQGSYLFTQDETYASGAAYALPGGQLAGSYAKGGDDDRKFVWAGVYPDGAFALSSSRHGREHSAIDSRIFDRASGAPIAITGFTDVVKSAVTPAFAGNGRAVVFNFWEGPGAGGVVAGAGHSLALMDFDCHPAAGSVTCGAPPYAFSNLRELYRDPGRYPGWPAFAPGLGHVVFHDTLRPGGGDGELATWQGAQADLWLATLPSATTPAAAAPLRALNGVSPSGASYLPRSPGHPGDELLNYEPTVGPIASGGYFWVVFTSRRAYGNVAAGDPYETGDGTHPVAKKLWIAAVDLAPRPGVDPSHPAFYLSGQELNAGNMRGFWAADPCAPDGDGCATGDECCGGFCRAETDGAPRTCTATPRGCAHDFEKCSVNADCCESPVSVICVNGRCTRRTPR